MQIRGNQRASKGAAASSVTTSSCHLPQRGRLYGRDRTTRRAVDEEDAPAAKKIDASGETSPATPQTKNKARFVERAKGGLGIHVVTERARQIGIYETTKGVF